MKKLTIMQYVSKLPCMACYDADKITVFEYRQRVDWIMENLDIAPRISDGHHVTPRGAGGEDTADNLMPLCRTHHGEVESPGKGLGWMMEKYPTVRSWLEVAGRTDVLERVERKKVCKRTNKK